ncbi:MAG: DUF3990 domain-containing protein [Lachnospiraceae bacterium]|nr:DUF3990 domain-containing protein [Lachnospiraceae bacterium]
MILYHTSDREIVHPDIHYGRKNADFGWGFYLTPDREFTCRWARDEAIVNTYELDENGLDVHSFSRNREWFEYIFQNRRVKDGLQSDVIIGPIANDTIFDTLGIITSGYLKPEDAMKLLMIGPEYRQVAIKTERAAGQLHFLGFERITGVDESIRKAEQDAFQIAFAEELQRIME